jgi:hypothetical protein
VVAHVISYDDLAPGGLLTLAARGWLRSSRINAIALGRYADLEEQLALLRERPQPRGLPAALGGRISLTETLIHHEDIRHRRTTARSQPSGCCPRRAPP